MLSNPAFIQQMLNPQTMQAAAQMFSGGAGAGAGGAQGGFPMFPMFGGYATCTLTLFVTAIYPNITNIT